MKLIKLARKRIAIPAASIRNSAASLVRRWAIISGGAYMAVIWTQVNRNVTKIPNRPRMKNDREIFFQLTIYSYENISYKK